MTRRAYLTEYRARDGGRFGLHLYADSEAQAVDLALRSELGEVIEGWSDKPIAPVARPSELAGKTRPKLERNLPRILHGACLLSWIAIKSGRMTVDEALDDTGVIHELAHRMHIGSAQGGDAELRALLRDLEGRVPELWP